MTPFKIAIIGAGSVGFTRKLVADVLCVPELRDIEIALTDIDEHNLAMVQRILATDDRSEPSADANHGDDRPPPGARRARATSSIACGSAASKRSPTTFASRCNTASTNASATRSAPAAFSTASARSRRSSTSASDIREVAESGAKLLNYANPMAMNTWAAIDHGGVDTIGLCHGVQHGWRQIAEALGAEDPHEVEYICAGINHQTWYIDVRLRGRSVGRDELLAAFERHPRLFAAGEGAHRRSQALRRLFNRKQRPPVGISAVVPQAAGGNPPLDRHVRMDSRRDRRLPAPLHRIAQLVRDGIPGRVGSGENAARSGAAHRRAREPHHRGVGDRARLSRPFQRQEPWLDRPISPTTRSSKARASSIASG